MARYLEIEFAIRHENVRPGIESRHMVSLGKELPVADVVRSQEEVAIFVEEHAVEQHEYQECDEAWYPFFLLDFEYIVHVLLLFCVQRYNFLV